VQVRAGSLSARVETSAATPAVSVADVTFGLGARAQADTVRVLWPSGILQTETAPATGALVVQELNRKPSSCPFLFTWNGERFEFLTDFMGAGEMGYWEGPGTWNQPNPVEYVRIPGDKLRARGGRFDVRVTNELEEALFADRFQLLAIAHPSDVSVYPNEGMAEAPKPVRLHAVRDERVPRRVTDDHGHDVTGLVASVDRRYPDDFALSPFRGFAASHSLTIDIGPTSGGTTLLLTGWTDYAFSSDNRAAQQAGLLLAFPILEVKDAAGGWRLVSKDVGIPVGRPQTIAVALDGLLKPGEHELRLVTNMRVYWDQIRLGTTVSADRLQIARLDPQTAVLRERGYSAVVEPDGKEPERYDYSRVSLISPWKAMPGRYTRQGDVRPLLLRADDEFVIAKPGDEIALQFSEHDAGVVPSGWTRTFLLMADGFSKEMDVNSASPDTLEPLPFHAMSRYPYPVSERYPETPEHDRYRRSYNSRVVAHPIPVLK
jgi:hypothetical protein